MFIFSGYRLKPKIEQTFKTLENPFTTLNTESKPNA